MKRGEIYYIQKRPTTGSEIAGARPAVIVSNDILNATSDVVMVVYLTTKPRKEMPTHAIIEATGLTSTAICEHIDHVSTELVGTYCGTCSEEEMTAIENAMLVALGIEIEEGVEDTKGVNFSLGETLRTAIVCAERDAYKKILDQMVSAAEVEG